MSFDMREQERKEKRGMSNEEFLDLVAGDCLDADAIVVVATDKNGDIQTYHSADAQLIALGLLSVGTDDLLKSMEVGND